MEQLSLDSLFIDFINKKTFFINKKILTSSFKPQNLLHRENEIRTISSILAPILKGDKPSNLFIYGKTGTGKTAAIHFILSELKMAAKRTKHNISSIYLNCKMRKVADTEYRILASLCQKLGQDVPYTGLPTNQIYKKFFETLENKKQLLIIVLDEIDAVVEKNGDGFLYNLIRINEELKNSQITLVGISNNISFIDHLDPRVRSSLSEEEIIFKPYNALQLKEILYKRAIKAFKKGTVEEGVIEKCAALAAQEHGDARRALDLLRVAGEIAERGGGMKIRKDHVDIAESKIDMDRILEIIQSQPKQSLMVLWSIIKLKENNGIGVQTGNIYEFYQSICDNNGLKPLTGRRVSDLIYEWDMFGVLTSEVISKGRYGRTRMIKLNLSSQILNKVKNILNTKFYTQ